MNILVTGGAGFIGSHTIKALLDRGDKVVCIDNFNSYYDVTLKRARISQLLAGYDFTIYEVDITNKAALSDIFAKHSFDAICHLAAQAGVRYSLENPDAYIQTNGVGSHNIFELARLHGVTKVVFASSSSVYGANTKLPFSETDSVDHPVSLYAATKRSNELEAYTYYHLHGLNIAALRFFTVYGPWGRPDMALFKFIDAINHGKPIDVYNNGKMERDFTYIDDIVSGILAAIDYCKGYEIFNLGNNNPVTLEHFIKTIESALGKTAQKNYLPIQPGDVPRTYADISKAEQLLGFTPKTGIEEGVANFVKWYNTYYSVI